MTLKPAEQWLAEMPLAPINRPAWLNAVKAEALRQAAEIVNDARYEGEQDLRSIRTRIEIAAAELDPPKKKE